MNKGTLRGALVKFKAALNIDIEGNVIHGNPLEGIRKGTAFFEFLKQMQEQRIMSTPAVNDIEDATNPIKRILDQLPRVKIMRHIW